MEIKVPESVPEQLLQTLEKDVFNYNRSLIGDARFLTEEEKKSIDHIGKELYRVQAELQSVAHERVVIDVLSRPVLAEIEHNRGLRIQASKEAYLQRRSGIDQPPSSSSRSGSGRGGFSSPEDPIFIPPYVPPYMKDTTRQNLTAPGMQTTSETYSTNNVAVRHTASTTLVPSMRTGYFPPEYKNLRMNPTDFSHHQQQPLKDPTKIKKKKKKMVSFEPLARSLQSKLLSTSQEMKRLKDRLTRTDNKFNKERLKSTRKLKLILDALEEKQVWKDHALMAAVEQLIQETLESFQDVVDEVDLLQILEEIVAQIPQPFIYEVPLPPPEPIVERRQTAEREPSPTKPQAEEEDESYAIINVTKRPTTIIRLPEPVEKIEMEVQTDVIEEKTEEEEEDLSPPPPPPAVIPPTVVEVTKPSVEKDLVAILNTVVDSNKVAMQGQQAIILALVQEMAEKMNVATETPAQPQVIIMPAPTPESLPQPILKEDKVVDTCDLPTFEPEPVLIEEAPAVKEESKEEILLPYRTAFGEVVLGGKSLSGPYKIPPKVTLTQALAQAGLNEFGEILHPDPDKLKVDAPVQRRAKPLTMMLLNRHVTPPVEPVSVKPATDNNFPSFVDFAHKLLEAVSSKKHDDDHMTKTEVMQAVQEGVKVGVRSALSNWEDDVDDFMLKGYRPMGTIHRQPVRSKGFPLHRLVEEKGQGEVLRKVVLEAEDDPLNLKNLQRDRDESRQRTKQLQRDEEDETRDNYHRNVDADLVSLAEEDEEFHAIYGDPYGMKCSDSSNMVSDMDSSHSSSVFLSQDTDFFKINKDKDLLRKASSYHHNPIRERRQSVPASTRREVPILRSAKIIQQSSSSPSFHRNGPKKTANSSDEMLSNDMGNSSWMDHIDEDSSHDKKYLKRFHDQEDDTDDPVLAEAIRVPGGLPPLVSSVLPHHATRVARDSGLYLHSKHDLLHSTDTTASSYTVDSSLGSLKRHRTHKGISHRIHARTKTRDSHTTLSGHNEVDKEQVTMNSHNNSSLGDEEDEVSDNTGGKVKKVDRSYHRHIHHEKDSSSVEKESSGMDHSISQHWSVDSSEPSLGPRAPYIPSKYYQKHKQGDRRKHKSHKDVASMSMLSSADLGNVDLGKSMVREVEGEEDTDWRDDVEYSIDSKSLVSSSSSSSIYSFNTSHSSIDPQRSDYIGRHVQIPLLSVGSAAAAKGRPRWNV